MKGRRISEHLRHALRRELWITIGPPVLLVLVAFAVTFHFVKPAPPRILVLATPKDEGGAAYYAKRYQQILKRDGVTVVVRPSEGSADDVALLSNEEALVDVAFVQGGTDAGKNEAGLVALSSISYVPLWVFYRGEPIDDPGALRGKKLAAGLPGSATHALAMKLLEANGADKAPTEVLPLERDAAFAALQEGAIDAAFVVAPAEAPALKKFAGAPGIRLLSFARADAYVRKFPYLTKLVLPRGVFDLANDVPANDVVLLAPTANLVAKPSLHPALAYLLLRAATEVHESAGLLDRRGEFPALLETGFPPSGEAKRYFTSGVPLLQRYLPFWAANLVDRLWVMLLPIIAVIIPLLRVLPAIFRWRVRSRIYRYYAKLKELELEIEDNPAPPVLEAMLVRLEQVDRAVHHIPAPLAYTDNLYFFREHVELVRRRITNRLAGGITPGAAPALEPEPGEQKTA